MQFIPALGYFFRDVMRMALDPATAKMIVQVVKVITDKKNRGKLLNLLLGILGGIVILLLLPLYLLTQPFEVLSDMFADPNETSAVRQFKAENDDKILTILPNLEFNGKYPLPCNKATIIKTYGSYTDPISKEISFHTGIDFQVKEASPVVSIDDGIVVATAISQDQEYGNFLVIKHKQSFYSVYTHLSKIYMFKGQSVKQGSVIGLIENKPEQNCHLHFEIRTGADGGFADPSGYILGKQQ